MPRDALFIQNYRKSAKLAAKNVLPSVSQIREYAEAGGLASYEPNLTEQFRHAATYVDKIFKGAKTARTAGGAILEVRVAHQHRTANVLGITFPQSLLLRAAEVIN